MEASLATKIVLWERDGVRSSIAVLGTGEDVEAERLQELAERADAKLQDVIDDAS